MAADLLADLLQSRRARRVLVIGAADTRALVAIASALPPDGRLLADPKAQSALIKSLFRKKR